MYLSVKAFHLIFMVAWFAGLFYIFRLFVYHRQKSDHTDICELLSLMEKRLLYYITIPASVVVTLLGTWLLILNPALLSQSWLWLKLFLVLLLFCYQAFSYRIYLRFKSRDFCISEKACRIINEMPTLLLISIVLLAVHKYIF